VEWSKARAAVGQRAIYIYLHVSIYIYIYINMYIYLYLYQSYVVHRRAEAIVVKWSEARAAVRRGAIYIYLFIHTYI